MLIHWTLILFALLWNISVFAEAPEKICTPTMIKIHKAFGTPNDPVLKICENAGKYEPSLLPDAQALPSGQFRSGEKDTYSFNEFMKSLNDNLNKFSKNDKCPTPPAKNETTLARPNLILEKTAVGTIPLSIVTEAEAQKIFDDFAQDSKFAFENPKEGCWARAHIMDQELEKKGIRAGKVFIEGSLRYYSKNAPNGNYVDWAFHVAPIVAVQTPKGVQMRVIDPSTSKKPLPVNEWTQNMSLNDKLKIPSKMYVTDRFTFFPIKHDGLGRYQNDPAQGRWHIAETMIAEKELKKRKKEIDLDTLHEDSTSFFKSKRMSK